MKPCSGYSDTSGEPWSAMPPPTESRPQLKDVIRSLDGTDEALRRLRVRLLQIEWAEVTES